MNKEWDFFVYRKQAAVSQFVSSSTLKLWVVPLVFVSVVWVSDLVINNFAETTVLWREWYAGTVHYKTIQHEYY